MLNQNIFVPETIFKQNAILIEAEIIQISGAESSLSYLRILNINTGQ